jgi:hypothetical protein
METVLTLTFKPTWSIGKDYASVNVAVVAQMLAFPAVMIAVSRNPHIAITNSLPS